MFIEVIPYSVSSSKEALNCARTVLSRTVKVKNLKKSQRDTAGGCIVGDFLRDDYKTTIGLYEHSEKYYYMQYQIVD